MLDVKENYMVFGNNKTLVIESGGNTWRTKEPAVMYFFKDSWYNIIVQFKKDGVYHYCNIATPFILEENTIKYIDYDIDLRIFPTGEYKVLDRMEYNYHKKIMNYSDDLDRSIHIGLEELINRFENKDHVFNIDNNLEYYKKYKKTKDLQEKSKVIK